MIEVPASALRAFRLVVRRMAGGEKLALLTHGDELSTQQAAELLNVSRPHVIKLLENGEIAFHKVGSHRRMATSDVLAYRARRNAKRQAAALTRPPLSVFDVIDRLASTVPEFATALREALGWIRAVALGRRARMPWWVDSPPRDRWVLSAP